MRVTERLCRGAEHMTPLATRLFGVSLASVSLMCCMNCETANSGDRPNIVLISIDTLRADRLGTYGYFRGTSPAIDELAKESIVFERCFAPMATTFPSHLSLFTGTYPNETGAIANVGAGGAPFQPTEHLRTLAQLLQTDAYHTAGFVSATPLKRFSGLASGFDVFGQPRSQSRRAEDTNAEVFEWIEARNDRPFFLWVHYFDPHRPYDSPPPFADMYDSGPQLKAYLTEHAFPPEKPGEPSVLDANNRYDGEIRYVDEHIGRLLAALRASLGDGLENTIVVLHSDHGEGLGQHGEMAHGGIWKEQLQVALLMRVPGHGPTRVDRLMSVADIVPTLMGLAELPGEDAFRHQASGFDVLESGSGADFVFSQESGAPWKLGPDETDPRYVLTGNEWKYFFQPAGTASLFRLSNDPHELVDVSAEHPDTVERLHSILMQRLEEQERRLALYEAATGAPDDSIDPAILEQLRSLGYLQ